MVDLASRPMLLVKLRLCGSQHHAPDFLSPGKNAGNH